MSALLAAAVAWRRRHSAGWSGVSLLALALTGPIAPACTQRLGGAERAGSPTKSQLPSSWLDRSLSPDERAKLLVEAMSLSEKLTLVTGYFGVQQDWNEYRFPEARPQSAGLVRGVPRLSFPPQWQGDAGSGVATQGEAPPALERTLLPSGILTASTWNPALAEQAGAMIGSEARATGFNVMLAGGVNLLRDPGNGRNFEYAGEDPLLAGIMVGALVRGIQSNRIVSTVKHFALNDQETGRRSVNVIVDEAAARMSDLLAFQLAIEQGDPGSVMCSYNLVNAVHACQNEWLLSRVLKSDWGFRGYVMADWGAQQDTVLDANAGLDQETGLRKQGDYQWLDKLANAIAAGRVKQGRLDDMVRRIARTFIAKGAIDDPVRPASIDFAEHAKVTQADAEEGIVLLKNADVLPLASSLKRVAVIGGHADAGVLTGGGSAQVYAPGGNAVRRLGLPHWPGPQVYAPSAPLSALRSELSNAAITWSDGSDLAAAAAAAAAAEVAIVFVTQWTAESLDFSLVLPDQQDKLVEAVARANRRTVVVLETGGPVLMPWIDDVAAALEAWYPGSEGGRAIARALSGAMNPSGHLPASFPRALEQLPRPSTAGVGLPKDTPFEVRYSEGAAVGYRWYDQKKLEPLFWFGHGLSYTRFAQQDLAARLSGGALEVSFRVVNTGPRAGKQVAQIYVSPLAGGWEAPKRLGAFAKVELEPGASAARTVRVDPRLLAVYEPARHAFHVAAGDYRVMLASSARNEDQSVSVRLPEQWLPAGAGAPAPIRAAELR
jgi:beta-glucosidase